MTNKDFCKSLIKTLGTLDHFSHFKLITMKITKHIYRFFDRDVEIVSDSAKTLDLMDAMYREFRIYDTKKNGQKALYEVLSSTLPGGKSLIRTEGYSYSVEDITLLPSIAHGIILRRTLSGIRSHLLFHAAALSYNDKGIILVADSGYGKTTLALAMVRQGFRFLSDEIAALSLSNGELVPYPRCLWIRPGTAGVFNYHGWNYPDHSIAINVGDREAVYLSPRFSGKACRLNYLIIIKNPHDSTERFYYVTLDSLDSSLIKDLESTAENHIVLEPRHQSDRKGHSRFPALKVRAGLLRMVYDICESHGKLVINAEEENLEPAFYYRSPELQKMSKLTAAVELSKSFYSGRFSTLVQDDFGGSAAMLLERLSGIMDHADCYRLAPGRLDMTVNEIYNIME